MPAVSPESDAHSKQNNQLQTIVEDLLFTKNTSYLSASGGRLSPSVHSYLFLAKFSLCSCPFFLFDGYPFFSFFAVIRRNYCRIFLAFFTSLIITSLRQAFRPKNLLICFCFSPQLQTSLTSNQIADEQSYYPHSFLLIDV